MDLPNNAYLKDLNNELNPYIGTYTANFEGNQITLYITKKEKKLEKSSKVNYYMDALIVKYLIKNNSGTILQDTRNNNTEINSLYSIGTKPQFNQVVLSYYGTNCGVGWGKVNLKKINSTQLSWDYRPNSRVIDKARCPGNPDLTVYIPESQNLIFTKQ
ncbi:hypothetical protein IQ37_04070 [Chryseobacterium piperi]|uniref:Uncharacterized protein n=2 Tax=Chryseobacterium piperi TaxID=558152 RepID=A0A086BLM1_9FLAO|nr:hypothetical protein CJF12_02435 [Chryseobacterium piperi]KFF29835.1 hypothetical protein IQ37_04070 [Chryseobacterium piperi]